MAFLVILAALLLLVVILYFVLFLVVTRVKGARDERCVEVLRNLGDNGHLDFYYDMPWQECGIESFDGIKLSGRYLDCGGSKKTAVLVHGYGMTGLIMLRFAPFYYEAGYNVLMVDMRAHGQSGGKTLGYGQDERHDLAAWVEYLLEQEPDQRILLHGESLGAATVLQYLGAYTLSDALPGNIAAAVADCPYTNAYEAAEAAGRVWLHIPTRPFMAVLNVIYGLARGITLREVDTLALVGEIKIPVMFLCGGKDEIFPLEMEKRLFDAVSSEKEMHIFGEAGHARSYALEPARYRELVLDFQKRYVYPERELYV